jgi:hypothetical protein
MTPNFEFTMTAITTLHGGSAIRPAIDALAASDAQERDGTSLDTQRHACLLYADDNGLTVLDRLPPPGPGPRGRRRAQLRVPCGHCRLTKLGMRAGHVSELGGKWRGRWACAGSRRQDEEVRSVGRFLYRDAADNGPDNSSLVKRPGLQDRLSLGRVPHGISPLVAPRAFLNETGGGR